VNFDLIYTNAVQKIGRTLAWKERLKDNDNTYDGPTKPHTMAEVDRKWDPQHFMGPGSKPKPDANLISSLLENGMHAPAIDIDLPAHLVPSSTPGHFHLYFDKEMPWKDYEKLLKVMADVGLVEKGFYSQAVKFQQTYLRLPHVKKEGA
jgi:hypothetical protein